ncbi:uncharacterized protein LOC124394275 isoform X1 [Silurus meridionalis]|uniref:uncharacterized protein LOC124394275 isoform X1 n=1 Tax=Silurus meridionalis TaxID=175797 RepID=UPI001EECD56D|nr:uncharacterized protein LOC124394275 isoform X1 [Silurus meridionalis]
MANRKSVTRSSVPTKIMSLPRTKVVIKDNVAHDSMEEKREEDLTLTRPKSPSSHARPVSFATASGEEIVAMLHEFLDTQKQQEERYLLALEGLRDAMLEAVRPAKAVTDIDSPAMALQTPTKHRRKAYHPNQEASTSIGSKSQPMPQMKPKLPIFQQGEDIQKFLHRFEHFARTWKWPENEWSCRLVPLLTGQALDAYLAMEEDRAEVYDDLKEALLEKLNITTENYRQQFRATTTPIGESPTETYNRLRDLYQCWVRPELHTKKEIGETLVLEQLLCVLPHKIQVWVKELEPKTGLAAAKLAQQYMELHGSQFSQPVSEITEEELLCVSMNDLAVPQKRDEGWYLSLMAPNTKGPEYAWLDPSRLYCNSQALSDCVKDLLKPFQNDIIDLVVGIDAMGFILGSAVAIVLGKGFLAFRKAGHLCVETQTQDYCDYTGKEKLMEVRVDVLKPGLRVLIVDQWIETGGTMKAAIKLVERQGASVVGVAAVAIENSKGGKWIKENYKYSHCIPKKLQPQIDNHYLESFKNFNS